MMCVSTQVGRPAKLRLFELKDAGHDVNACDDVVGVRRLPVGVCVVGVDVSAGGACR